MRITPGVVIVVLVNAFVFFMVYRHRAVLTSCSSEACREVDATDHTTAMTPHRFKNDEPRIFPSTCNLTWFKQELRLDSTPPVIPRELISQCRRIIYNRIPKCASTTFKQVFAELARQHQAINGPSDETMKLANSSFFLTKHFFFVRFPEAYHPELTIYLEIVREPFSWEESIYSYKTYGTNARPVSGRVGIRNTQTLMECIDAGTPGCLWLGKAPMSFLCGTDDICRARNHNRESLSRALYNVDNYYLTVGLYEDLPGYMEILEYLMPQMFSNITQVYDYISSQTIRDTATVSKYPLDQEHREKIKSAMMYEVELYDRLRMRSNKLLSAIRTLKSMAIR